jgi:uncharacterized membrane protein
MEPTRRVDVRARQAGRTGSEAREAPEGGSMQSLETMLQVGRPSQFASRPRRRGTAVAATIAIGALVTALWAAYFAAGAGADYPEPDAWALTAD